MRHISPHSGVSSSSGRLIAVAWFSAERYDLRAPEFDVVNLNDSSKRAERALATGAQLELAWRIPAADAAPLAADGDCSDACS
jgi:hypothetical protein